MDLESEINFKHRDVCHLHKYDSQYCVSLRWHKGVTNKDKTLLYNYIAYFITHV